jgi:uncharacterized protein
MNVRRHGNLADKVPAPPAEVAPEAGSTQAFHVLAKPIGPICNIDCSYCFYLEKEALYPGTRKWAMPQEILEPFIRQYIEQARAAGSPEVHFAWQGGEPTLLGVRFFQRIVEIQKKYAGGATIQNGFQTNGTLLDDAWCEFLAANRFLVGLSIDGPRELHDYYRVDKQGKGTFDQVMRGLGFLRKHGVEFNTLTVVNRMNSQRPLEVYRFLKQIGSNFMQFIPLVERRAEQGTGGDLVDVTIGGQARRNGRIEALADPPDPGGAGPGEAVVTDWSVEAETFGSFLCAIFDQWVRQDIGRYFVQLFDVALGQWMGLGSSLCVFRPECGSALAIEHNGDLYSCDHYVYPQYRLGNLADRTLAEMANSAQQQKFGRDKLALLPKYCRDCDVRFACNGECPKHRFIRTPDGEPGLNYLCAAYKRFFHHVDPHMKAMAALLRRGEPAAMYMRALASTNQPTQTARPAQKRLAPDSQHRPGRNDPCPCGSGRKFKKCHGAA